MIGLRAAAIILIFAAFCSHSALAGDGVVQRLDMGGTDRSTIFYRPPDLSLAAPVPLVIVLHGGFGSGAQAERSYGWDEQADRSGFVVAYPNGIGRSWNAGGSCCGPANRDDVDDIGFITALIDQLVQTQHVDPKRIYLTGMSNGAALAYRYGCDGTRPIAAIGSVSGSLSAPCPHPSPSSVMEIHGLEDHNIPFDGGQGTKGVTHIAWLPVDQALAGFRTADACRLPHTTQSNDVQIQAWDCAAGRSVTLITLENAGHQWPGARSRSPFAAQLLRLDPPSDALNATETLWQFFGAHTLP